MEYPGQTYILVKAATTYGRRRRDTSYLLPSEPIMYFDKFVPTPHPELQFNHTNYYKHQLELDKGNKIDPQIIRNELSMDDVERFANTTVQRMMVGPSGEAKPAYLPLLLDLKGYFHHGGVPVFVQWLFNHHVFAEGEIVPRDVVPIFDLVPTFDAESTITFAFPLTEKHIFIGAKTNSIHVLKIEDRMSILKINVFSGVTKVNGVHYHRVSVCGKVPSDVDKPVFPVGEFVMCWNAKDISRPSFMHNFRNLYDCYTPMLFIITEARPHDIILWKLVASLPGPYQGSFSGYGVVGGVMLLWNKLAEPYFSRRSSCLTGHLMGVEVEPGPSIVPTRFDDVTPQEVFYPANEYDEDIQN